MGKECRAQNIQAPSLHTHVVWRSAWFSIGAVKSINVNVNVNVCVFWCALFVYMCMFQPDKNTTKRCFVFTDSMAIGSIEILYFFDSHTELKFKLYKIVLVFFFATIEDKCASFTIHLIFLFKLKYRNIEAHVFFSLSPSSAPSTFHWIWNEFLYLNKRYFIHVFFRSSIFFHSIAISEIMAILYHSQSIV